MFRLDEFEVTAGLADLDRFHFRHNSFLNSVGDMLMFKVDVRCRGCRRLRVSGGAAHKTSDARLTARSLGFSYASVLEDSPRTMLGAVAGLGEIAVGAVLHGIGVAVAELVFMELLPLGCVRRLLEPFPRSASLRR